MNRFPGNPAYQTAAPAGGSAAVSSIDSWPSTEISAIRNAGFAILVAFLFMIFSRVFDVRFDELHAPGISYRLMGAVILITGSFVTAFRSKIGKNFLGFTICFVLAIPFSVWRLGSLHIFTNQWLMGVVVFTSTASLIPDFKQYQRAIASLSLAFLVFSVICLKFGDMSSGRLLLESGRFANPNEIAQALLIGLPFWIALASRSRALPKKLFSALVVALMLYLISKTGSRGAVISFGLLYLAMIRHATPIGRIRLLLAGGLAVCAALALLPGNLKERYRTMFSADTGDLEASADSDILDRAVTSTQSRKDLLKQSLDITLHHPLFGVGPGMFMVEEDRLAKAQGKRKGSWLGTHNSYTQISSECGIPALLFFAATLILSLNAARSLYRVARSHPDLKDVSSHAEALYFSLIGYAVTALFVHAAYTAIMPVLAGLAVSLARTTSHMLVKAPEAAPAPQAAAGYRLPIPARTM